MSLFGRFRKLLGWQMQNKYSTKPNRVIPITPSKPTSGVIEAFQRKYISGTDLSLWAESLLTAGFDSYSITTALGSAELHWQRVPVLFAEMCREIGLSDDIASEIAEVKEEVMIEEYRHGLRSGSELLFSLDNLRKRVGFAEMIIARINEDSENGTNDSGFYGNSSGMRGAELEGKVRQQLEKAGILRAE